MKNLRIHEHGGDVYRNAVTMDFSVNINPFGMPEACRQAAVEGVRCSESYPNPRAQELKSAISVQTGVPAEQLILGNGAAEVLMTVLRAVAPDRCLLPVPSFFEYERAACACGAEPDYLPLNEEEGFSFSGNFLRTVAEKIRNSAVQGKKTAVVVGNPNNPTGREIPEPILRELLEECVRNEATLVLDESFLPFLAEGLTVPGVELTEEKPEKFPKLVVIRSFTKIYAMPGLRLGYAIVGDAAVGERAEQLIQPWNVSLPAQMAGVAALRDENYLKQSLPEVRRQREWLEKELSSGLTEKVYPGSAPFLLFRSREDLKERFLEHGVLIRSCADFRGLDRNMFRIAVKREEENRKLIEIWRKIL